MDVKSWFNVTIGKRIAVGFIGVLAVTVASNIYTYLVLDQGINRIDEITNRVEPSVEALNDFHLLIYQTKMYTGNWVYQQTNKVDKDKLINIRESKFSIVKNRVQRFYSDTLEYTNEEYENKQKIDLALKDFEKFLLEIETNIMFKLSSFEDYNDPMKMMETTEFIESEKGVNNTLDDLIRRVESINDSNLKNSKSLKNRMKSSFDSLGQLIVILSVIVILIAMTVSFLTTNIIKSNVYRLKAAIDMLRQGEIPQKVEVKTNDEIGDMGGAVNQLIDGLNNYSKFALKIGDGDFDSEFHKLGENDIIGTSLMSMRDNLKAVSDEDHQRDWAQRGLTEISAILRNETNNLNKLSYDVVRGVVEFMKINQGGIYIAEKHEEDDNFDTILVMTGCYAYNREKLVNRSIFPGEGLVGQCWMERKHILLTEVPENYVRITSGLGEATPSSIIVVPLIINEEMFGVLELASFSKFKDFEIEFMCKIGEIIASSISAVKNNEITKKLLMESKELANSLQAQEEELRQNQEEMLATQEESTRQYHEALRELDVSKKTIENLNEKLTKTQEELDSLKKNGNKSEE